jgi:CRISPR-associated endonuclease/helicase Cas3
MNAREFEDAFQKLTEHPPFPWQRELFQQFVSGQFPPCNLPTGLGKTAVIPIWLIALGAKPTLVPRRLVYVVNRGTVVDQATREADKIRRNLSRVPNLTTTLRKLSALNLESPLAISTLRGQLADNGEWRTDPARPAIIVGTVDLIGSRLLFQGYRAGFKWRPLYAGFLGQDTLLVHDEAHLEPAFQRILNAIQGEQRRCRDFKPFHVLELTATPCNEGKSFSLTAADEKNPMLRKRLRAKKIVTLHATREPKKLADRITELALDHEGSGQAILLFLRRVEDVANVCKRLPRNAWIQLTGTLRGLERDELLRDRVFTRFLPASDRTNDVTPRAGTVYLVCTSAGEVGANLSADHLVCDLTPFDSIAQRFGRVNRFGDGDARIDVVYSTKFDDKDEFDVHCRRTLKVLNRLKQDACPAALEDLMREITDEERTAVFSPRPVILPTSDILFDAWALTTVRGKLPGRPCVADYLHGVSGWEPPETYVAWREEVEHLPNAGYSGEELANLLSEYPLKPHELLRDRSDRVYKQLLELAREHPDHLVWRVSHEGEVGISSLAVLLEDKAHILDCTVLLPPGMGGLLNGTLEGKAPFSSEVHYDVADEWYDSEGNQLRKRVWDDESDPLGMRLIRRIDKHSQNEDAAEELVPARREWRWFVRPRFADDEGSRVSLIAVDLATHLADVERVATRIAEALQLPSYLRTALIVAARFHDLGKVHPFWQRSIGNHDPNRPLAKSGSRRPPEIRINFRHEFGSLLDVQRQADFKVLRPDVQDLVLHLIATHHGRGRPHFPPHEESDPGPGYSERDAIEISREVPRRFARLQREYGRWGLAYVESLLRAADAAASANPTRSEG